ncbi:hypothetical protein RYZ27_02715 [Hyphomonas sp. FCG-A18]|uniref:hypothetical protein n=1 Tax=Hyphomonas sp. FCG-A18 TaxID=3080019 RepID=UPI002B2D8AE6|nr:hypothetical protein RYZ27_02715 [Hyphomonas sp. FCG-A18]
MQRHIRQLLGKPVVEESNNLPKLEKIRRHLLLGKSWRYLRYVHLRDALLRISDDIKTVGVVGAGGGFAEFALAIEFPHIHFTLTDIIDDTYPRFQNVMKLSWDWDINNIDFRVWDVLTPTSRRFDLVCSTEVLEHILEDDLAASRMRDAALKYVYCLVPFGSKTENDDPDVREYALKTHGHHVFGYDAQRLEALFPNPEFLAGAYFDDAGQKLRAQLGALDTEEITAQIKALTALGEKDLQDRIPDTPFEGQGIKILSRV